jgi:hypothetical protein
MSIRLKLAKCGEQNLRASVSLGNADDKIPRERKSLACKLH